MSFCERFKYLGSWITYDLSDDFDVNCRINAARQQFYAWRLGIFQNRDMPLEIRVKFYKAVIVNTLLWGCETWGMTARHRRQLESFHHTCLRSILRISRMQRISNSEIRERANISTMRDMYELRRARYLHKIARMNAHWCAGKHRTCEHSWHHGSSLRATPRSDQPTQIEHGDGLAKRYDMATGIHFASLGSTTLGPWIYRPGWWKPEMLIDGEQGWRTSWASNQVLSSHFITRKTILVDYFYYRFHRRLDVRVLALPYRDNFTPLRNFGRETQANWRNETSE